MRCVFTAQVIVLYEQGYGEKIVLPEDTGFGEALRWQFTGDNISPPTVDRVASCWAWAKK